MDIEKTIQFILEQQAHSPAQQQQFLEEFREGLRTVTGVVHHVAQLQARQQEQIGSQQQQIGGLTQIVGKLAERQSHTDEVVAQVAEALRHTDERLNALIKVVDDLVRRDGSRA